MSRAFLGELIVIERKERLKLRKRQTDNSKIRFHGDKINDLPPPNTRFLRLFFADFLQSHVLPVKLDATGIGYPRRFERYDDVVAGARDCACPSVSGAVLEREFGGSFGSDFAVAVGDWQ